MGRELEEILRQQVAQPANSCASENGVSFLDQVISPLYDVVASVGSFMFSLSSFLAFPLFFLFTLTFQFPVSVIPLCSYQG